MGRHSFGFEAALCAVMLAAASAFGAATTKPAPTVIDMSSTYGEVIAQSAYYQQNSAEKAFDKDTTTTAGRWLVPPGTASMYFKYRFNSDTGPVVDGIRISVYSGGERAPKAWTLYGSNTGEDGSWVVLDSRSGQDGWTSSEVRTFTFSNTTAYKYYWFNCTENNKASNYYELNEMEFLSGCLQDLAVARNEAGSVVDSSPSYQNLPASNAFNGILRDATNRWVAQRSANMYLVYRFNEPTKVNALSVITPAANVNNLTDSRAPKAWTFSGSHDGVTWTVLDTQENETGWASTGEERYYQIRNNTAYQYYKFNCTDVNNASNDVLQIMELEFYNAPAPYLDDFSVSHNGTTGDLSVSAKVLANDADMVAAVVYDGAVATTNIYPSSVSVGGTASWTFPGVSADKTYAVGVFAMNSYGSDMYYDFVYTGAPALGAVTDASEYNFTVGTVEVSRASADLLPLTVYYTITGNAGSEGSTWVAPVPVTISAGETTAYLTVTPLLDFGVASDVTATVTLVGDNYVSGGSKTLTIVNSDTPQGYDCVTITNAFDNPFGGYLNSDVTKVPFNGFSNLTDRVIRFVHPDDAPAGLREFTLTAASDIANSSYMFTHDWMLFPSFAETGTGTTVDRVHYVSESETLSGLTAKRSMRVYAGSWYVPTTKTYSFRRHMTHGGIFSIDGKLILRQFGAGAVTTNGVELSAGWHSFYVGLVASDGKVIGPASGETLGLSFSDENAELTAANPGSAFGPFDTESGYRFSTAFNAVLVPSMWAAGGDVSIDCSNLTGDLRVAGQLGTLNHYYWFAAMPAGRTIEFGRPIYLPSSCEGWQGLTTCAYVDWTRTSVPTGVNIRFEGAMVVNKTWTDAGRGVWNGSDHSAFTLGRYALITTDVANFFGTHTDEFRYPDGLRYLHVGRPDVLGDTAKIYVPDYYSFGYGSSPFDWSVKWVNGVPIKGLPIGRTGATKFRFRNNIELGTASVVNATLPGGDGDDQLLGNVHGAQSTSHLKITGWQRYMKLLGSVNVSDVNVGQRGCRMSFRPVAGSAASSITGTLTLSNETAKNPGSGWNYAGAVFFYCPDDPSEHPFSINKVNARAAAYMPENVSLGTSNPTSTTRQGATLSTCSNSTVNVTSLQGGGVHLRTVFPTAGASVLDDNKEAGAGPANFVFGEINGNAAMPIFVSSNVNITVTNIVKSAAFHYEVMSNGVNAAVLDIEGDVADGTTITATDFAMLPARVKGFTGKTITLTDMAAGQTYPVVFDFDQKGGIPIGGCDGSGTLAGAPTTGTINLTLTGIPKTGTWGILKFDSVPEGLFTNWTVNAPTTYNNYVVSVEKTPTGFVLHAGKGLMLIVR